MNLNCVICAELFIQSDEVFVTLCGHMFHYLCLKQWFERSKTCPQCRNKCTERNIHRIYFNLANLDTSKIDIGTLQQQLENTNLKLKINENDLKKSEDEIKKLKDIQKKSMQTITNLEKKLEQNSFLILSYNERIKMMKIEQKANEDLQQQIKELKQEIDLLNSVSTILSASTVDAEKLLESECNPKKLATWVAILKRELRTSESKKTDIRNILQVVKHDYRKAHDLNKMYEERLSLLESSNYQLTEKIKLFEANQKDPSNFSISTCEDVLITSPNRNSLPKRRMVVLDSLNNPSPGISEKVKQIEESESPYLKIKSSSIGLGPLLKLGIEKNQRKTDLVVTNKIKHLNGGQNEKYSIFQKARGDPELASSKLDNKFVFNGVGGSEKKDLFGSFHNSAEEKMKTLSNRLKAGKLRKFPSAGSEKLTNFLSKS